MNFSILDWNIQGTQYYTKTSFDKISPTLKRSKADIFCIQEGQDLISKFNKIAKFKSFHHVFSEENKDGANVIFSRFPIVSSGEFNPNLNTDKPLGKILWADIKIGNEIVKIYNSHFEIDGVGPKDRIALLKFIFNDSKEHQGGVIICGDLNTTIPENGIGRKIVQFFHSEKNISLIKNKKKSEDDERYYFLETAKKAGFRDVLDISKTTWCIDLFHWEILHLKLDWFFIRELTVDKVTLNKYISDHKSIFVHCSTSK